MTDESPFGHEPAHDPVDVDPLLPPVLVPPSDDDTEPPADRLPTRYRSSLAAGALAAGMLGLRDILEAPKDDRPVVEQHVDGADRVRPIEVHLDPDDPAASNVTLRDDA